jgi:hypothetical protein
MLIVKKMIFVLQIQVVKSLMRRTFKRENMQLMRWGVLKNYGLRNAYILWTPTVIATTGGRGRERKKEVNFLWHMELQEEKPMYPFSLKNS